jgi:hypothetical protein
MKYVFSNQPGEMRLFGCKRDFVQFSERQKLAYDAGAGHIKLRRESGRIILGKNLPPKRCGGTAYGCKPLIPVVICIPKFNSAAAKGSYNGDRRQYCHVGANPDYAQDYVSKLLWYAVMMILHDFLLRRQNERNLPSATRIFGRKARSRRG